MATKNSGKSAPTPLRGFSIPLTSNGPGGNLTIEVGKAPAPSRYFTADGFCIKEHFGQMSMAFVQRKFDGRSIRAMLDLRMSFHSFKALADLLDADGLPSETPFEYLISSDFEEPVQTLAFEVSFGRVNANMIASNIEFYYVSGTSAGAMEARGEVVAEDVVSIQFPNFMLAPLFIEIKRLAGEIKILQSPEIRNDK